MIDDFKMPSSFEEVPSLSSDGSASDLIAIKLLTEPVYIFGDSVITEGPLFGPWRTRRIKHGPKS